VNATVSLVGGPIDTVSLVVHFTLGCPLYLGHSHGSALVIHSALVIQWTAAPMDGTTRPVVVVVGVGPTSQWRRESSTVRSSTILLKFIFRWRHSLDTTSYAALLSVSINMTQTERQCQNFVHRFFMENPLQSYRASPAIWDRTVLPEIRQRASLSLNSTHFDCADVNFTILLAVDLDD